MLLRFQFECPTSRISFLSVSEKVQVLEEAVPQSRKLVNILRFVVVRERSGTGNSSSNNIIMNLQVSSG
jgi:hypothetical protein